MFVLSTSASNAIGRSFGRNAEAKRIGGGVVRGGQMDPQAHGSNPCDLEGPGT